MFARSFHVPWNQTACTLHTMCALFTVIKSLQRGCHAADCENTLVWCLVRQVSPPAYLTDGSLPGPWRMLSGRRDGRASDVESSVSVCAGNKMERTLTLTHRSYLKEQFIQQKSTVQELFPPLLELQSFTVPQLFFLTHGSAVSFHVFQGTRSFCGHYTQNTEVRQLFLRPTEPDQHGSLPPWGFSKQSSWIAKKVSMDVDPLKVQYSPSKNTCFLLHCW